MNQDEYIKELKELYEMAKKSGDISMAIALLDAIKQKDKDD